MTVPEEVDDPTLGRSAVIHNSRLRLLPRLLLLLLMLIYFYALFAGGCYIWFLWITGSRLIGPDDLPFGAVVVCVFLPASALVTTYFADLVSRLRNPVRLLIGERGFQFFPGFGPILWREVAHARVTYAPRGGLRLNITLADYRAFLATHRGNAASRLSVRVMRGHILLDQATREAYFEALLVP
jgi:hypothetical protein